MGELPELKRLHRDAVPRALERAKHYRLLNEPSEAESICRDILGVDPDNADARITLILSLTDQLGRKHGVDVSTLRAEAAKLGNDYEREYYLGIIAERQGKASLKQDHPGCGFDAYDWLHEAMEHYARAEKSAPAHDDDAILRWNACARKIQDDSRVRPRHAEDREGFLE